MQSKFPFKPFCNYSDNGNTRQENENRGTFHDGGALKLTFDKKVRFGEQLSFATKAGNGLELFESELAKPIEFRNNFKVPTSAVQKKKGVNVSKKLKKETKRPGTATA